MAIPEVQPTVLYDTDLGDCVNFLDLDTEKVVDLLRKYGVSDEYISGLIIKFKRYASPDKDKAFEGISTFINRGKNTVSVFSATYAPYYKTMEVYLENLLRVSDIKSKDPQDELQATVIHELGHVVDHYEGRQGEMDHSKSIILAAAGLGAFAMSVYSSLILKQGEVIDLGLTSGTGLFSYFALAKYNRWRESRKYRATEARIEAFSAQEEPSVKDMTFLDPKRKVIRNILIFGNTKFLFD